MSDGQSEFRSALLDPALPAPDGLTNPDGTPASRRFDVYRNNVAVSLTEALITAFPALYRQVGDAFFRAMAGAYLRAHPPISPLMMHYGQDMPAFLSTFAPVRKYGYFPDLARLELARRRAYHAADAAPVTPDALSIPPERLMQAHMRIAPAVQIIRSRWPLHAIWQQTLDDGPKPEMTAQDILITRPEFDPQITLLPSGGAAFINALINERTFGEANDTGTAEAPEFDLSATFGTLLSGSAITEILERDTK